MSIDFQHPEYVKNIERWKLCENICTSTEVEQYLRTLNPDDGSTENKNRNADYIDQAVFYAIAGHTLDGTTGLIFIKDPQIVLPAQIEYLRENVDGAGVSFGQQAQDTALEVQMKGRAGLFVTYPATDGPLSVADMETGGFMSTIHEIDALQIINWRTVIRGSKIILSLVVILESVQEVQEDGYSTNPVDQIRELALKDDIFVVQTWRKDDKGEWVVYDAPVTPVDASGSLWDEIPFTFVGATSNSSKVDESPMYPMCALNKAHYRNSADYEDSVWYVGQAQAWASGLTQSHIDLMKENKMYMGSRTLMAVPSGEKLDFATPPPNTLVKEAMDGKLETMIGMGARFIRASGQVKTATEAVGDSRSQYSGLSMISVNLSDAYTQALQWAMRYMGVTGEAYLKTTTEFVSPTATSQDVQAMVAGFIQGAITISSYFKWLQRVGIEDSEKTIEDFTEEIGKTNMPDFGESGS